MKWSLFDLVDKTRVQTLMRTAENSCSHANMIMPFRRMQTNIASKKWFIEKMYAFTVTIIVSSEFLLIEIDRWMTNERVAQARSSEDDLIITTMVIRLTNMWLTKKVHHWDDQACWYSSEEIVNSLLVQSMICLCNTTTDEYRWKAKLYTWPPIDLDWRHLDPSWSMPWPSMGGPNQIPAIDPLLDRWKVFSLKQIVSVSKLNELNLFFEHHPLLLIKYPSSGWHEACRR